MESRTHAEAALNHAHGSVEFSYKVQLSSICKVSGGLCSGWKLDKAILVQNLAQPLMRNLKIGPSTSDWGKAKKTSSLLAETERLNFCSKILYLKIPGYKKWLLPCEYQNLQMNIYLACRLWVASQLELLGEKAISLRHILTLSPNKITFLQAMRIIKGILTQMLIMLELHTHMIRWGEHSAPHFEVIRMLLPLEIGHNNLDSTYCENKFLRGGYVNWSVSKPLSSDLHLESLLDCELAWWENFLPAICWWPLDYCPAIIQEIYHLFSVYRSIHHYSFNGFDLFKGLVHQ